MTQPGNLPPRALAYWGVIEGAVRDRLGTADIWSLIRDQAEASGLASAGISAAQVSRMRGMAAGVRRSAETFARADEQNGIHSSMIGTAPWARSLALQDAMPLYQVRFQHTFTEEGEERTEWRTVMFRGVLPGTVGDLTSAVDQDAQQMAENYGTEHVGIGSISILQV